MSALDQMTAAAMMETAIATLHGLSNNEDFTPEERKTFADARDIIQEKMTDGGGETDGDEE